MKAEILSIGTEILLGEIVDTNAAYIASRLPALGIDIHFKAVVGDNLDRLVDTIARARGRSDVVICTGGLGPTQDDLTREAIALMAGVDLVEDAASVEIIRDMFAKRGRVMPDRNRVQARFPRGAEPLFNSCGTAPGAGSYSFVVHQPDL